MIKAEKRAARRKIKALLPLLTSRELKLLAKAREKKTILKKPQPRPGIKQWCLEQGEKLQNFSRMKEKGLL